jgi:hypothetical protein
MGPRGYDTIFYRNRKNVLNRGWLEPPKYLREEQPEILEKNLLKLLEKTI